MICKLCQDIKECTHVVKGKMRHKVTNKRIAQIGPEISNPHEMSLFSTYRMPESREITKQDGRIVGVLPNPTKVTQNSLVNCEQST